MMKNSYADLHRLIVSTKPSKPLLLLAGLFVVIEIAGTLWFPILTRDLVDFLGEGKQFGALLWQLLGVLLSLAIAGGISRFLLAKAGQAVVRTLRTKIASKLIHQPVRFFDKQASGELASRVVNDSTVISTLVTTQIMNLISGVLLLVGSAVVLLILDVRLTLVLFGLIFAAFLVIIPIAMKMEAIAKSTQDKTASLTGILTQVFSEMRLVKAFLAEDREIRRSKVEIAALYKLGIRDAKVSVALEPIISLAMTLSIISILGYGGFRVAAGDLSVGTLTAFILYIFNVAGPLALLSAFVAELQTAKGASVRIVAILDSDDERLDSGKEIAPLHGDIRFDNVSFSYGADSPLVLDRLNITIKAGETTALVGVSGSGKSTILSLIERFYSPQSGTIFSDEKPIDQISLYEWREQIGYVPQGAPVMPGSIRDNICYGLSRQVSDEELRVAAKSAHCLAFVDDSEKGFDTDLSEQGSNISGGQRQRIAIARMFLRDPAILILDEAMSNLDSETEHHVKDALATLMKGRTNIVVSHRLSTVMDADKIIVLEAGVLSGEGSHRELVSNNALYARLVKHQFEKHV